MNKEYLDKLCGARRTLCGFCEADECERCIVNRLIDDAYDELPDRDKAELDGEYCAECESDYEDEDIDNSNMPAKSRKDEEFDYISSFIAEPSFEKAFDEEIYCKQLRCLWTSYCLRHNLDVDTSSYDNDLLSLWEKMEDSYDGGEVEAACWSDFDSFDLYMGEYLC